MLDFSFHQKHYLLLLHADYWLVSGYLRRFLSFLSVLILRDAVLGCKKSCFSRHILYFPMRFSDDYRPVRSFSYLVAGKYGHIYGFAYMWLFL